MVVATVMARATEVRRRSRSKASSSSTSAIPFPTGTPYTPTKAPEGAPNVLIVLYDDTGLAAWSPFGGRINMPTLQKLADNGLMYSQWHTTALCSPTRSTFLTGRNHHLNGMACITEGAERLSRRERPHPGRVRHDRAGPPGQRLEHVLAGQEPQRARGRTSPRARAASSGRCRRASIASTASSAARPTSGTPTSSRTTGSSTSRTRRRRATTSPRISPTRRSR